MIGKVNCPEGMTITPDGDRIYLASQCGSGNDPVFVIDTSTEDVTAIPGFPVGHNVAVAPARQKVYVSRLITRPSMQRERLSRFLPR